MHLVSVALFHVDLDGWMPSDSCLFVVGKMKVVNDVFIGTNKSLEICLCFVNRSTHVNCKTSCNFRSVVKSLNRQFALISKKNDHTLLIDFVIKSLRQLNSLNNDRFYEIIEGVNKIGSKST